MDSSFFSFSSVSMEASVTVVSARRIIFRFSAPASLPTEESVTFVAERSRVTSCG